MNAESSLGVEAVVAPDDGACDAPRCHVYVVTHYVIPADQPENECSSCGRPLAEHQKRTSSMVPRNQAYIIDERRLDV